MVPITSVLQVTEEATGEFNPIGTLVVLILLAAFAYGTYWTWNRAGVADGASVWVWRIASIVLGVLVILIIFSLLLNLLAALGML